MPLKSGGAVDNEKMRGRTNAGLISVGTLGQGIIYAGLRTTPGKIVKLQTSSGTIEKISTLTLDAGEDDVRSLLIDGDFLYAGLGTNPGMIVKVNLTTFQKVATLTFLAGETRAVDLAVDGNFLYAGTAQSIPGTTPANIVKVNLTTFTEVDRITLTPGGSGVGERQIHSIIISGGFLYASIFETSPINEIVKVDLSTFTRVATLVFSADGTEDQPMALAVSGGFLYTSFSEVSGKVAKVNLSTFSSVGTVAISGAGASTLQIVGTNLYAITEGGLVDHYVNKINLASFSVTATLLFSSDYMAYGRSAVWTNFLYIAINEVPGKIVEVKLSTFTVSTTLTLDVGEDDVEPLVVAT